VSYDSWLTAQFEAHAPAGPYLSYVQSIANAGEPPASTGNPFFESVFVRARTGEDQLRQRATFALSQIFVVSWNPVGQGSFGAAAYYDMLYRNAFGNLRTLLEEVTYSWQMGVYLSHIGNLAPDPQSGRIPDENYAREVMQLFSIGLWELNPDGTRRKDAQGRDIPTYDQDDIQGMARVMTGLLNPECTRLADATCRRTNGYSSASALTRPMQIDPAAHASGAKAIVGGITIPAGQSVAKDIDDALDALFEHPNFCPFIGRQLIQRFTTSNPSPDYVLAVSRACENDGRGRRGEMRAILRAILLYPDARDPATAASARFGKVREPVIRFAHFLRAFTRGPADARIPIQAQVDDFGEQMPLNAGSVFNFYRPDYTTPNLRVAGLEAPEFQITHEGTLTGWFDYLLPRAGARNFLPGDGRVTGLDFDYAALQSLAQSNDLAFIDRLDLILTGSTASEVTRRELLRAVNRVPASQSFERVQQAVFLLMVSPDYLVQK